MSLGPETTLGSAERSAIATLARQTAWAKLRDGDREQKVCRVEFKTASAG